MIYFVWIFFYWNFNYLINNWILSFYLFFSSIDHNEENIVGIPSSLCNGELYPLGMESGEIADMQITASSSYNVQSVGPQNARSVLNYSSAVATLPFFNCHFKHRLLSTALNFYCLLFRPKCIFFLI